MTRIARIRAQPLNAPMRGPFAISTGSQSSVKNVLVEVELEDGTPGYGECAPFPAFNGETQAGALAQLRRRIPSLIGRPIEDRSRLLADFNEGMPFASARAGLEMALLDAWSRRLRLPLYVYFGGAGDRVCTDVTIPLVSPGEARRSSAAIARRGIRALKIKVGTDPGEDSLRVRAAMKANPKATLIVDGNGGYSARRALDLLRRLKKAGLVPDLFEQPVRKEDLAGLQAVSRAGVPVAADESAATPADVLTLARTGAAQVINIKLMKSGIQGALEMARTARAAGLGLMIGGMIESRLAMACAAHLAAGFGGFRFIDLDTPLYFAVEPMRGPGIGRGGLWDLSRVGAGIGVAPLLTRRAR